MLFVARSVFVGFLQGKQDGTACYYCWQAFQSRFKSQGKGWGEVTKKVGEDPEFHQEFQDYRESLIQYYIEHGGRVSSVPWADIDVRTIQLKKKRQVAIVAPEVNLVDEKFYREMWGSPSKNGHVVTDEYGQKEVKVAWSRSVT